MADLEQAGLKLVAEGVTAYLADIEKANKATEAFFKTLTDDAQKSVAGLNDVAKAAGKVFDDVGDGAKKTTGPLDDSRKATDKWGDALKDAGKNVSAFGEIATGALRRIGELAVDVMGQAAEAVFDFAKDSIMAAGDFEAGVNRLASIAGDSLAEIGLSLNDVSEKALQLGKDTAFSAAEALDAMTELAKGGVDMALIMGEATDATLNLAAAGELNLANAAEIVAKTLAVWASEGVTAIQATDLLAQAANASTVDVEELALGLYNAQGAAKAAGVTYKDFVTVMALIAPGFSSAADAGTSYKVFLSRLIPATDKAEGAMKRLGLATADGKSLFFDSTGAYIGNEKAAQLLQDRLGGLTKAQLLRDTGVIFGQDSQRTAILLMEQGAAGYQKMAESMVRAGSAAEQAAKRNQGFNFAVETLKGSIETLGINLGTIFLPILNDVVVALTGIANIAIDMAAAVKKGESVFWAFSEGVNTMKEDFPVLVGAWNALQAAITGVVSHQTAINAFGLIVERAFGPEAAGWAISFGQAIDTLSKHWDAIAGALVGVGAALAASAIIATLTAIGSAIAVILSPVGLVVAAIAALGAAWYTNFGGIQELTYAAIEGIQTFGAMVVERFNSIRPTLVAFATNLMNLGTTVLTYITPTAEQANAVWTALGMVWTYIQGLVAALGVAFNTAFAKMNEVLAQNHIQVAGISEAMTFFWTLIQNIAMVIVATLVAAFLALLTAGGAVLAFFLNLLPSAITFAVGIINAFGALVVGLQNLFVNFVNFIAALFTGNWALAWDMCELLIEQFAKDVGAILMGLGVALGAIMQGLADGVIAAFNYLYMAVVGASIVPDMVNAIIGWFTTLATMASEIITTAMTAILTAITSAATTIVTTVTDMVMRVVAVVVANLPTWVATLATWAREAWEWLVDALPLVITQITLWVTTIITAITDALVTWIDILSEWAREAWEWLSDAIPNLIDYLSQFFSKIKEWAANVLKEIVASAKRWAEEAYKWVKEKAIPGVLSALADFLSQMKAKFDDIKDQLRKKAEEIGEAIVNGIKNVIKDAKDAIVRLFVSVINAAISAAKAALGISSPSKVFEAIGEQTMQGFLDGVLAGAKMAKSAVSGAMKAISADGSLNAAFNMSSSTIHAIGDAMRSAGSLNAPASASQITNQTIYNNTYNVNNALNYRTERSSQGVAMDWNMLQTFGGGVGV